MGLTKCIYASSRFEELSKKHNISWTEAARVGMAVMLSEKGEDVYENELNERRKREFKKNKIRNLEEEKDGSQQICS
jgi:hypothetical protein